MLEISQELYKMQITDFKIKNYDMRHGKCVQHMGNVSQ